jgi:hypothetical protein
MIMLVNFNMDSMGNVTASPVREEYRKLFVDHMEQFRPNDDGTAFLQEHHANDLQGMIPERKFKELMEGYRVTCRMSFYDYGMMLGYDACMVNL